MRLNTFYSLTNSHDFFYRGRDQCRCFFNKNYVHVCVARLKERWRDAVRLLSKKIERCTHKNDLLKNQTSLSRSNELSNFICRSSRHRKVIRPHIHRCPYFNDKGNVQLLERGKILFKNIRVDNLFCVFH